MINSKNGLEEYKIFRLYSMDFGEVLHTFKVLRRYKKKDIRCVLIRDIIIAYCRPFTESKGDKGKKHRLSSKAVHPNMKDLHKKLLDLRHQLFAHTDLTYKKPKVAKWSDKLFIMSFKGFDYKTIENELSKIKQLIEYAQEWVNNSISDYEKILLAP